MLAVGGAPERLADIDEKSSKLACDATRMAVEYLFDVIEATRHAPILPPSSKPGRGRFPSKRL